MPSGGDASVSKESKAKENFYLSEGKLIKKEVGRCAFFLLLSQEWRYLKEAS
jgi:hypothetical protein